jgi:hypothetical protein
VGDITALPMAKAGVFAEAAARVVADDIAARRYGDVLQQTYEGQARATSSSAAEESGWSRPTSSAGRRQSRNSWDRPENSPPTSWHSQRHGESAGSAHERPRMKDGIDVLENAKSCQPERLQDLTWRL